MLLVEFTDKHLTLPANPPRNIQVSAGDRSNIAVPRIPESVSVPGMNIYVRREVEVESTQVASGDNDDSWAMTHAAPTQVATT